MPRVEKPPGPGRLFSEADPLQLALSSVGCGHEQGDLLVVQGLLCEQKGVWASKAAARCSITAARNATLLALSGEQVAKKLVLLQDFAESGHVDT